MSINGENLTLKHIATLEGTTSLCYHKGILFVFEGVEKWDLGSMMGNRSTLS